MDDCEEEKNFDFKGKILKKVQYLTKIFWIFFNFLTDTLSKKSQNIVAYSFVSEHSKYLFLMLRNKLAFLSGEGGRPLIFKWYTFYRKKTFIVCLFTLNCPLATPLSVYTSAHKQLRRRITQTLFVNSPVQLWSLYLSIHLYIYLSIHPSIYLSI